MSEAIETEQGLRCPNCGAFCSETTDNLMPYGYSWKAVCENCGLGLEEADKDE